jgi:hypothetical protein
MHKIDLLDDYSINADSEKREDDEAENNTNLSNE